MIEVLQDNGFWYVVFPWVDSPVLSALFGVLVVTVLFRFWTRILK